MTRNILVLGDHHSSQIHAHFGKELLRESAGYLYCGVGEVRADPWRGQPITKFLVRQFEPIPVSSVVSASYNHITWQTATFIRALRRSREESETIAVVHNHVGDFDEFSEQDNCNEAELFALATKRNGEARLISVIILPDGRLLGRLWTKDSRPESLELIIVSGKRLQLHYHGRGETKPITFLHRQSLALGEILNQDLAQLRIAVVGCGATGSAIALLLPRLGVKFLALFDQDLADETNLNRLHFASYSDARQGALKVDVLKRGIDAMELGTDVKVYPGWINNIASREALKSCDVIFGCTDDNAGRLLLNRFAYFYRTPVIDMGLAIQVGSGNPPAVQAFDGRVTVVQPGSTCLFCRGIINIERAYAEQLKRANPADYERQKQEAYVIGERNPSPAVVPFTTSVATMAVEELIHRLQGFRGVQGSVDHRIRQFHRSADRRLGHLPAEDCPLCASEEYWGRGDIDPFLDANL